MSDELELEEPEEREPAPAERELEEPPGAALMAYHRRLALEQVERG